MFTNGGYFRGTTSSAEYYALTYDKSERGKHQFREEIWTYLEELLPDWVLGVPFAENLIALLVPLKASTYNENRVELLNLMVPCSEEGFCRAKTLKLTQ